MMVQRRIFRFIRYARLPFVLTVCCGVLSSAAGVAGGFALAELLRRVQAQLDAAGALARR